MISDVFSILMIFVYFFFFLMIRRPPRSTLFPYTTLFRPHRRGQLDVDHLAVLGNRLAGGGHGLGSPRPQGDPGDGLPDAGRLDHWPGARAHLLDSGRLVAQHGRRRRRLHGDRLCDGRRSRAGRPARPGDGLDHDRPVALAGARGAARHADRGAAGLARGARRPGLSCAAGRYLALAGGTSTWQLPGVEAWVSRWCALPHDPLASDSLAARLGHDRADLLRRDGRLPGHVPAYYLRRGTPGSRPGALTGDAWQPARQRRGQPDRRSDAIARGRVCRLVVPDGVRGGAALDVDARPGAVDWTRLRLHAGERDRPSFADGGAERSTGVHAWHRPRAERHLRQHGLDHGSSGRRLVDRDVRLWRAGHPLRERLAARRHLSDRWRPPPRST